MSDRVLHFRFEHQTHERLDKFLTESLPEFSRSRIQGLIANGLVDVNGLAAKKAGQTLEAGANVTIRIPPPAPTNLVAEDIPLDIVFENDELMVINKPAGMVVHPAAGHASGFINHHQVLIFKNNIKWNIFSDQICRRRWRNPNRHIGTSFKGLTSLPGCETVHVH